jgi:hypothetical protein
MRGPQANVGNNQTEGYDLIPQSGPGQIALAYVTVIRDVWRLSCLGKTRRSEEKEQMGHVIRVQAGVPETPCCPSSCNTDAKGDVPSGALSDHRSKSTNCEHGLVASSLTEGFDYSVALGGIEVNRESLESGRKLAWDDLGLSRSPQQWSYAVFWLGLLHGATRRMPCRLGRSQEHMSRTLQWLALSRLYKTDSS